ncbi:MAG: 4Fe-4S ferredoxin [Ruminococcaceae bacterium]|nr:4Fe-4S ferredoxin [Oscillospiraceae bacterium]
MLKCSLSVLDSVFSRISEKMDLYLPVKREDGKAEYKKWQGEEWSENLNTVKSPKDFFFPQSEDLVRFRTEGKSVEVIDEREEKAPFAVFGVRACDVRSFEILDKVFLEEPRDSFYAMRREAGIIVSVACQRPAETCFCKAFGIDAADPSGDVTCWKTDSELYLRANTDKGESFISIFADLLTECDDTEVEKEKEKISRILEKLPLNGLSTESFGAGKTEELFERAEWADLCEACLGCGTCTFVCPTCQCYDIKDIKTGNGVLRYRCWDSCMYSEFTKMAHGNNRLTQRERFRQRFMHKLVYFPENNGGVFGCVGCGRCLKSCPVSMNIVKVMKELGDK